MHYASHAPSLITTLECCFHVVHFAFLLCYFVVLCCSNIVPLEFHVAQQSYLHCPIIDATASPSQQLNLSPSH